MTPPAPELHWKDILTYGFVGEFELIKYVWSRADISEAPWAQPLNRKIATKHFKILRAREELQRIHVEMRRIRVAIAAEENDYKAAIVSLLISDPLLAAELTSQYSIRARVNTQLLEGLRRVEALPGYTGPSSPYSVMTSSSSSPVIDGSGPPLSSAAPQAALEEVQDLEYDEVSEAQNSEGLEACLGADGSFGETNIPQHMLYDFQL